MALKCVKCKNDGQFSIHGRCECGYQAPRRYNVGGLENEPSPTSFDGVLYSSRRAAGRASRAAGNDGGGARK